MTIVVGYPTQKRAKPVLNLAGTLARSSGEDVVVCTAIRDPRVPGIARDHPRFRSFVDDIVDRALDDAREHMPTDIKARYVKVNAHSISTGLIEVAERHNASTIVVGSAMGRIEHVTLSSIADRVLHSAPMPVAVATRGFRALDHVKRVTLAFAGGPHGPMNVAAAEALADRLGAQLRLASFAVHLSPPEASRVEREGPSAYDTWVRAVRSEINAAVGADAATARRAPEFVVGQGDDWQDALDDVDWASGDLIVVGSSDAGPISRVFLGSRASKIIRHAPVPTIAIPRYAAAELADE